MLSFLQIERCFYTSKYFCLRPIVTKHNVKIDLNEAIQTNHKWITGTYWPKPTPFDTIIWVYELSNPYYISKAIEKLLSFESLEKLRDHYYELYEDALNDPLFPINDLEVILECYDDWIDIDYIREMISSNPNALPFLSQHIDYVSEAGLCANPNAIELLDKLESISERCIKNNPNLVTYNYEAIRSDRRELNQEVMAFVYHPSKIANWIERGNDIETYLN